MSPRRSDDLDFILRHRGRKKKRADRIRRRRRAGVILGVFAVVVIIAVLSAGLGAGAALSQSCDLNTLRPVEIGQNSFVFARDGSVLGSIPAERNREPVSNRQMSKWLPRATVSIEDRRFYQHGGVDYEGIARAAWKDVTAGKVVEGGSTITQQLVRNLYIGQEKTLKRKVKEACLAIKLSSKWPKSKILNEYLNTVYYGNHAYGVEAASQTYFSKPASQLTLLESAMLAGLPQAPSDLRPVPQPAGSARPPRRGAARDALERRADVAAVRPRGQVEHARAEGRPHLHAHQAAVLLLVRDRRARARVRREHRARRRAEGLHDDRPAFAAERRQGDARRPAVPVGPCVGDRLGRARHRRDPRHDRCRPQCEEPVQPRRAVASPGRLDVQDVRARVGDRAGRRPRLDVLHVGAVHVLARPVVPGAVLGAHLRQRLPRVDVADARDALVGQHGVRAADARRRPALRVADGAPARRAHVAGHARRVDRPRLARRLAARHGGCLRDVRGDGDLREADGDHEGDPAREQGRRGQRLGQAADQARGQRGRCLEGQRRAAPERSLRHRRRLERRAAPERRQDGHDGEPRRRVVRRLHAPAQHRRLDGLSEGRDPDAERARPGGRGRDLPRPDLARVHGGGALAPQGARLRAAEPLSGLALDHPRELRELRVHPDLRADVHPAVHVQHDDDDRRLRHRL